MAKFIDGRLFSLASITTYLCQHDGIFDVPCTHFPLLYVGTNVRRWAEISVGYGVSLWISISKTSKRSTVIDCVRLSVYIPITCPEPIPQIMMNDHAAMDAAARKHYWGSSLRADVCITFRSLSSSTSVAARASVVSTQRPRARELNVIDVISA